MFPMVFKGTNSVRDQNAVVETQQTTSLELILSLGLEPLMRKLMLSLLLLSTTGVAARQYDLVLEGGRVMDPETGLDAVRNVAIGDGKIVRIAPERLSGRRVVHPTGLAFAPAFLHLPHHLP